LINTILKKFIGDLRILMTDFSEILTDKMLRTGQKNNRGTGQVSIPKYFCNLQKYCILTLLTTNCE
jgi:hypothetical protein